MALALLCISLLIASCSAGGQFETPSTPTTIPLDVSTEQPEQVPLEATQTAEAAEQQMIIERVVIATAIHDDGAPANEVSVLSQEQQNVYLSIRARHIPGNAQFQANWFENSEPIGRSETTVGQSDQARWVSLGFRPIALLNPAAVHSVELVVNDRLIDTYAFRVGVGNASDVIAEANLAAGVDEDGRPIGAATQFDPSTSQVALVTRISRMVNPTGMIFTAQWMRGPVLLHQSVPDGGQPGAGGERMSFTYTPQGRLVPGEHRVILRLNGAVISEYPFLVAPLNGSAEESPDEETDDQEPTEPPPGDNVEILSFGLALAVSGETSAPEQLIDHLEAWPTQEIELFVALEVANLRSANALEIVISIANGIVARHNYPVAATGHGWLSYPVTMRAPDVPDATVIYEISIRVDNVQVASTTLTIQSTLEPPPPPTEPPDDEDEQDGDSDDDG